MSDDEGVWLPIATNGHSKAIPLHLLSTLLFLVNLLIHLKSHFILADVRSNREILLSQPKFVIGTYRHHNSSSKPLLSSYCDAEAREELESALMKAKKQIEVTRESFHER